jgi:hypothetical protein
MGYMEMFLVNGRLAPFMFAFISHHHKNKIMQRNENQSFDFYECMKGLPLRLPC